MSNKTPLSLIVTQGFSLADRIVAGEFDYGDGKLQRKRAAIAANMIALAEGDMMKHIWEGSDDTGKINTINGLKNLPTKDADDAIQGLWPHMNDEHKKLHMENHPESRFKVMEDHQDRVHEQEAQTEVDTQQQHEENNEELRERHKRRNRNKRVRERDRGTEDDDDEWWNKLSLSEQKQYLRDHPKSKKARRWRIGVRNIAMKAMAPIHHEIRKMGHEYRTGMDGIRAMRNGRKMNPEQKEALQNVSKRMAKVLLHSLATVALFTPLAPYAMDIGNKYFEHLNKRGDLGDDHKKTPRQNSNDEDDSNNESHPTTVGQTNGNNNGGSPTTVGQTTPQASTSGTNLHGSLRKKTREEHKQDETELEWMRRDFTEWLMQQDTQKLEKEFKPRSKR